MSIPKGLATRTFQLFRQPATLRGFAVSASRPPPPDLPPTLPADVPVEEETFPFCDPKYFLPVNPGDVLSTDIRFWSKLDLALLPRWGCVTVKVTASNPVDEETARHEQILTSYLEKNPSHEGCKFVSKMLDNFEVPGEEGLSTYSIWQACTHLSTLA